MKIKKLSLYGFKSFMDRLDFSFPVGISGIVGPNGCGKSNVVDAIRWCMGEQSPRQLRGRRMEDVIFNGTGKHKALGMTEVTLLFENGDGSFPEAFAQDEELAVTRRLYRSGESEYLINNVPCRLKDIQEMFMDTGLGNRAYSIIGQGQISTIIEQKPEETRAMLEEAAGITKYRRKVEASERKIEMTRANLQRVEDILGEIQTQMRSLKRQAAKAAHYKTVCQEIQSAELILYANTYHGLGEESGSRMRSTEELVQQEAVRSAALSGLQARVETMNLELEEKDAELSGLRKRHMQLRDRVHAKEANLNSLAQELRMQDDLEERHKREQEEIGARLQHLADDRARLEGEVRQAGEKTARKEGEISVFEKRVQARQDALKRVKEEYEEARERLSQGSNRETGLSHESDYLNRMLRQVTDGRTRLEKELAENRKRAEEIIGASERKSRSREITVERLREIEAAMERENAGRDELEERREALNTMLRAADGDLNAAQSRLSSLRSLMENFEGFQMGVRTVMKATDLKPRQEGRILGLLADAIHVEPQYEQAVEAVLADRLQYVIVKSQEDGRLAVEYLREKQRGRGSFVPLNELGGAERANRRFPAGGSLAEKVSTAEPYRTLVDSLLGDTVLVSSLEEAIGAWKSNGRDLCFVTPHGDVVDHRGVVSGGKLTQSSHGLLARKREMAELERRSSELRGRVEDLNHQIGHVAAGIQERKQAAASLAEERWNCQEEINDFDKQLFRLGQELDQLERLAGKMREEAAQKEIEQRKHRRELSRVEEELGDRRVKRQAEEEYLQRKEIELKESEREFDEQRETLSGLRAECLLLREEQRGLLREMQMKEEYASDSRKRMQKIAEELALGRKRREEIDSRREELRGELSAACEKLKEAEEAVNEADRERHEAMSAIRETESDADGIRQELDVLREGIGRARMEHSEILYKMNGLKDAVKEKYDMDLSQIYRQYLEEAFAPKDAEERIAQLKEKRQRIGEVNLTAIREHEALKERFEFISGQRDDLMRSIEDLQTAIQRINKTSLERFRATLEEVDAKLKVVFPILFSGGTAGLRLTDETRPLESGILVEVQPPGKRLSHMGLLSGGEKALVAMALLFSIYMIRPSPFCLLDEVDAPLDEANIDRFNSLLAEIRKSSQIIMVTHSRKTMEIVDRLFGVTMEKNGISKTVAVDLERYRDENAPALSSSTVH